MGFNQPTNQNMITTKHCDICDTELPPMAFVHSYECTDASLHEKHPDKNFSWIRVAASPEYTNGSCDRRPDVCPECFLRLLKAVVSRFEKTKKRSQADLKRWLEWRQTSLKKETVRDGANEKRRVEKP